MNKSKQKKILTSNNQKTLSPVESTKSLSNKQTNKIQDQLSILNIDIKHNPQIYNNYNNQMIKKKEIKNKV